MKKSLLILISLCIGYGQNSDNPSQQTFTTPPPSSFTNINGAVTGQGNAIAYYWVVVNFAGGQGIGPNFVQVRNIPDTLGGSNRVNVSWTPVTGGISYDVLKTATASIASPCTCALVKGSTLATISDTGQSLTSYTYAPMPTANGSIRLDNSGPIPKFITIPAIGGTPGPAGPAGPTGPGGPAGPSGTPGVPGYSPNAILSGGIPIWIGGLTFTVSAAQYQIGGVTYNTPQQNITLDVADPSDPRFDVIAVDTTSSVIVLKGTPSGTPLIPATNPSTQITLTAVLIPTNSLVPANIVSQLIYDEDNGGPTEWVASRSGTGFNLASTINPYHVIKDIEATGVGNNDYVQFADGTLTLDTTNYLILNFRSKGSWAKKGLVIQFYSGVDAVGSSVFINEGAFGFVTTNVSSYQQIVIPVTLFGSPTITANQLRMTVAGGGGNSIGFYLDWITLQSGLPSPNAPTALTWAGIWNNTASYAVNNVVRDSTGVAWVSLQANTDITPGTDATIWIAMMTTLPPSGAAGGDLCGNYPNPSVCQVNGAIVPVSSTSGIATNGSGQLIAGSFAAAPTNSAIYTVCPSVMSGAGTLMVMEVTADCTLTLPAIATGWSIAVQNSSAHNIIVQPPGGVNLRQDGANVSSVTVANPQTEYFTTDGTSFLTTYVPPASTNATTVNGGSIPTSQPIVGTNVSGQFINGPALPLTRANGGFNSSSPGTGILRDGTTPGASELSGDVVTSGSNATVLAARYKVKSCIVIMGDPGAASPALADDNDSPVACDNDTSSDWTITTISCWANAGSPTVTPILTGGSGTSLLTGALTCGTASWAAGTVQASPPVVHSFSGTGATCSSTPCSIDVNITTAGGTAKYLVVKIIGTI